MSTPGSGMKRRLLSILSAGLVAALLSLPCLAAQSPPAAPTSPPEALPEAPSATRSGLDPTLPPCPADIPPAQAGAVKATAACTPASPYHRFVDAVPPPLTSRQKGYLAFHDVVDPANLATIALVSAFSTGIDAHTAYGPGFKGFGRNAGISLAGDITGEFIGTYAIASLAHEEPRYHRLPQASVKRRLVHALSRTVLAQHDDGRNMPNYEILLTYPISAEISNLYVPGIHGNGASTVRRFLVGYATDPADNLITEFLPDFARRIHVRIIFVQQILNQLASDGGPLS